MRIAIGGIHIECSTYSPIFTTLQDFRVVRDRELLEAPCFSFLSDYEATFLPTLHARAIPGGPLTSETYNLLKAEFLERLKSLLPVDGLYLAMHGAMYVEGMEDAEGDWIQAAREVVGDNCLISASYDLHGNVSQKVIDALDLFSAYRTAPHVDVEETMRRSVSMLLHGLKDGTRPILAWSPIPVVLPGECTSTDDEPAKGLYERLPLLSATSGVWDVSLMVGYVWADEPRVTAAVILTGSNRDALELYAKELALAYWNARDDFAFGCKTGSIEECVRWAVEGTSTPVVLADSGDNPTAGGVGDRADVLAELLRQQATGVVLAGIADCPAVERCFASGVGTEVELSIGATLDPAGSTPHRVRGTIRSLHGHDVPSERQAVLEVAGVLVVLSARRRPYHDIADFTHLGIHPSDAKIVVVKSGYLSPELARIANPNLMALSPGAVDQFVDRLPRLRKHHPTFPFDRNFEFVPEVHFSRGLRQRSA